MATRLAELETLGARIDGEVILPASPSYDEARRPQVARFEDVRPQAVVRCATAADVVEAIALARRSGVGTATRSGGHCFAGRSSTDGILIDVGPLRSVVVDDGTVTVGAGARLGDVYDALAEHGLTIAAGCGPTVGIAGLALGGGIGMLGRRHGLTSDQLVAAQIVLADGRVVECDAQRRSDLFWALRGAGCGTLGVVTRLVLRTLPAPTATTIHLTWPFADAAAVIDAWQSWAPVAPDELAASVLLTAGGDVDRPPVVHVFGAMLGSRADAEAPLASLVARAGAAPAAVALETMPYRAAKRHLAEHGPADEPLEGGHGYSKSECFERSLPTGTVAALVEHFAHARVPDAPRVLDVMPLGGAYSRVPAEATAFPHRSARYLIKHEVVVAADATAGQIAAASGWLTESWAKVRPWGTGGVYANFPDPELRDPGRAYWGANYERLLEVKAAYDPDDVFASELSA